MPRSWRRTSRLLKKELAELKAGRGSQEAVNKAKDDLDATVEELYQDYPELKKVLTLWFQ
jgi:hypothetical protein